MSETIFGILVLGALNFYPWYLILSKTARRRAVKSAWWMSKATDEEIESGETIILGIALIGAATFGIITIATIVAALVN